MAKFRLIIDAVFHEHRVEDTSQYEPGLGGPTKIVKAGTIVEGVKERFPFGAKELVREPKGYFAYLWEECPRTKSPGHMTRLHEEPPEFVPRDLVRHRTCSAPIAKGIPFSQQNTKPPMKLWYARVNKYNLPAQHILAPTAEKARDLMHYFCSDLPPGFVVTKEDVIITEESMEEARVLM